MGDLVGKKFGRYTVLEQSTEPSKQRKWKCVCECGTVRAVAGGDLKRGHSRSCGCYQKEMPERFTHRKSNSSIYFTWNNMMRRCYKPNTTHYHRYGGRGIKVCDEWHDFNKFYQDMGDPPEGKSLDRIDNDGNYEPKNCRWADTKTQSRNRSKNKVISFNGKTQTLIAWSEELGINYQTLHTRINELGWDIAKSLHGGAYR